MSTAPFSASSLPATPAGRPDLRPPSADSRGTGLAMSLVAHAVLIAALTLGVQWRTEEPAGVAAELWAAVPEVAAPPAQPPAEVTPPPKPEPAPPPRPAKPVDDNAEREAQIAVEKAKRLQREKDEAAEEARQAKLAKEKAQKAEKDKADKERAERDRQEQAAKDKAAKDKADKDKADKEKADKAAQAKLEQLRQDNIRRMNEQLAGSGAPGSTGTAARDAGPSANYAGRIKARIKPNIVLTDTLSGNPSAEVEVLVDALGNITGRRLVKPSGSKEWDETVLRAIDRTGVLPRDTDGRIPPKLVIAFKPYE